MTIDPDLEVYRQIVEQLEVSSTLLTEHSPYRSRMALILSDATTDIITYRILRNEFEHDGYSKWVIPQRYPVSRKREIEKVYPKKLKVVRRRLRIPRKLASALEIGHKYRNIAYHNDYQNNTVASTIGCLVFHAACDLFSRTNGSVGVSAIGFREPVPWLASYGFKKNFVDFTVTTRRIARRLKRSVPSHFERSKETLTTDILQRIAAVRATIGTLPWKTSETLDPVLKALEFHDRCSKVEDELSEAYRILVYKIAGGKGHKVSNAEYVKSKDTFTKRYQERLNAYTPECRCRILDEVNQACKALSDVESQWDLLPVYHSCDAPLRMMERYVASAAREYDQAVQMEVDRRRGK